MALGSPATAFDQSPNGNHAQVSPPAKFAEGHSGTGLLPGPVDCNPAVIAPAQRTTGGSGITIEAWFRTTTTTGSEVIVHMMPRIEGLDWVLIRDGTKISFAGCDANVTNADGKWHFVVASYQGQSTQIFFDGALVCSVSTTRPAWNWPQNRQVIIGSYAPAFGSLFCSPFRGQIDEVHLLDVARDAAQVAADFAAPHLSLEANTVGLWHFDEASANRCCPAGSTCDATGSCANAAPVAAACAAGTVPSCNGLCCTAAAHCGVSAATGTIACMVEMLARGDLGKEVCAGRVCQEGTHCAVSATVCCPPDHPLGCGDSCCPEGARCDAGACECLAERPPCGDWCCDTGAQCVDGECQPRCSDPEFPAACGGWCCPAGVGCKDGSCGCPSDHPVACGSFCCLTGATCSGGTCGCPAGRPACGQLCCGAGQICQAGQCIMKPAANPCQCVCNNGQACQHNSDCPVETPGVPPVCGCPVGC